MGCICMDVWRGVWIYVRKMSTFFSFFFFDLIYKIYLKSITFIKLKIIVYQGKSYIIAKRNVVALFRNKQKYKYTSYMQVMLMRLMSKLTYLIMSKGIKFMGRLN